MSHKKGALTFPDNPLAAMRGLEALDAPGSEAGGTPGTEGGGTVAQTDTLPHYHTTGSVVGNTTAPEAVSAPAAQAAPEDPLRTALLALLARPYAPPGKTAPTTVTSIKVPTDIWERLGWVAQTTGRNKQDIIAEALRQYFETVRRDLTAGR